MTYDKQKEVCCIVSRNFHYWKRLHSCNKFMENQWKGNGHKQRTPFGENRFKPNPSGEHIYSDDSGK